MAKATAVAHPNIALVKYWGRIDDNLNLPANPSLSMNLAALRTVTTVEFRPELCSDQVIIDGAPISGKAARRVTTHLDRIRGAAGFETRAQVASRNDFPAGTGLASSASAFAALSTAAAQAAGLSLGEGALSRLARLGSGSACRSVPAGFCLWQGKGEDTSHARSVAPPGHWALHDVIAIVSREPKAVSSDEGHSLAPTSPFFRARLQTVPGLLGQTIRAILDRDLNALGPAVERDALAMHAVMMTCEPPLFYWKPATLAVMEAVRAWRVEGLAVYCTLDAGPNVHCLCQEWDAVDVEARLRSLRGVEEVLNSGPGGGARVTADHLF